MEYLIGYQSAASSDEEDASLPSRARKKRRSVNASTDASTEADGADSESRSGESPACVLADKVSFLHKRRHGHERSDIPSRTVF